LLNRRLEHEVTWRASVAVALTPDHEAWLLNEFLRHFDLFGADFEAGFESTKNAGSFASRANGACKTPFLGMPSPGNSLFPAQKPAKTRCS
jgi:hypothetical protein